MEWIREVAAFLVFFTIFMTLHLFSHGVRGGHKEDEEHKDHAGKGKRGQGSTSLEM